jgi:hypothetical protein
VQLAISEQAADWVVDETDVASSTPLQKTDSGN